MQELARQRHEEGLRLARERHASLLPEVRALVDASERTLISRFVRMFAGTEDMSKSKGHQPCIVLSVEEFREFRKSEPAKHRWAKFEEEFLDFGNL